MPHSMPVSTNGHDPQLDQLPAALEYRLDGEFDLFPDEIQAGEFDLFPDEIQAGEFDLSPDAVYSVARHRIDTVMLRWPPGVSRNCVMCIVPQIILQSSCQ